MTIERASEIAAKWWADQLRKRVVGNAGDVAPATSLLMAMKMLGSARASEDELKTFELILRKSIFDFLVTAQCWYEDDPARGRGLRVVSTSYSPCALLASAARRAGIDADTFPVYALMWIDPDGVRTKSGYDSRVDEMRDGSTSL